MQDAFGAPEQRFTARMDYTASGELESLMDAKSNETEFTYDGFGRLLKTIYPHPSTTDEETLTYDAHGRLASKQLRDGSHIYFCYDNLYRLLKYSTAASDTACTTPKVSYTYDLMGRTTDVVEGAHTNSYVYDAFSRRVSETQAGRTVSYEYDAAGRRTRMTWPDSFYVTYEYNTAGDLTAIKENGGTALATFAYDNMGRRTTLTRSNGGLTGYSYNTASWLTGLANYPANGSYDIFVSLAYNPAGQIVTRTPDNPAYAYTPPANFTDTYTSNSLNQYTSAGGITPTYDSRGNTTYDGTKTYGYDFANRLTSASGSPSATLSYDPVGRLYQVAGPSTTRFVYDGVDMIAEYSTAGAVLRRYIHGPGLDEPLVWFEGAGHSGSGAPDRRHLYADERGSIVAVEGGAVAVNTYDAFGVPGGSNDGTFQYTGQMWLPEAGLYHYKARAYNPELGRFMQPDPIGYGDGMNLYNYVGSDPFNLIDPFGMLSCPPGDTSCVEITPNDDCNELCRRRLDNAFWSIFGFPVLIPAAIGNSGACLAASGFAGVASSLPKGPVYNAGLAANGAFIAGGGASAGLFYDSSTGEYGYSGSASLLAGFAASAGAGGGISVPAPDSSAPSVVLGGAGFGVGAEFEFSKGSVGVGIDLKDKPVTPVPSIKGNPELRGTGAAGFAIYTGVKWDGSVSCGTM